MNHEAGGHGDSFDNAPGPRVFISHSSKDIDVARTLRREVETFGGLCWLAPDDVTGTTPWADQIVAAIEGADLILVVVSAHSMTSAHVAREVGLASEMAKPVVPIRTDDTPASGAIRYHLQPLHWLDSRDPGQWRDQLRHRLRSERPITLPASAIVTDSLTPQARKIVTILAVSRARTEVEDPEVRSRTSDALAPTVQAIVEQHGGTVSSIRGAIQLGFFGVPRTHEDDVARALRAALEIRRVLGEALSGEPKAAVGGAIATGELLVAEDAGPADVTGAAVDDAVTLSQRA